jgi:hypothetical protein
MLHVIGVLGQLELAQLLASQHQPLLQMEDIRLGVQIDLMEISAF